MVIIDIKLFRREEDKKETKKLFVMLFLKEVFSDRMTAKQIEFLSLDRKQKMKENAESIHDKFEDANGKFKQSQQESSQVRKDIKYQFYFKE